MAITFGILAALISAVAIWLGYLNGLAKDEQHEHLTREIKIRTANEGKLASLRDLIKKQNSEFDGQAAILKEEFAVMDQKQEERAQKESELKSLEAEVAALEVRKQKYKEALPTSGEVTKLVEALRRLKGAIAALDEKIVQLKAEIEDRDNQIINQENTIAYNKKWMKNHSEFQSQEELNGKIKRIYKNWGFVVIDTGDVGGLTPRSSLLVKRDGEVICELLVKNSTNSKATAQILFDKMKEGDFIQLDDVVVAKPKPVVPVQGVQSPSVIDPDPADKQDEPKADTEKINPDNF